MSHPRHRQERWLHTRISEKLEDALKSEARRQRTPVSLLVRNVLEGALDLVEDIVEDSLHIAQRSKRFAENVSRSSRAPSTRLDDIYGWQELILNRAAECGQCDTDLDSGTSAFRGLRERAGPTVFLCTACVHKLGNGNNKRKDEKAS